MQLDQDQLVSDVQQLIRIPSILSNAQEGAPYGIASLQALEAILEIGNRLGFTTKNVDGQAGHIECGSGDELIGILAHVDVVPADGEWKYPAFSGELAEGKIWGRGTIDDKGPAVAALYAMKQAEEQGLLHGKRVRLIIGTNEENLWTDMEYYLAREEHPKVAFTPDANFPLIHGEKGILNFDLVLEQVQLENQFVTLQSFTSGSGRNMVPGLAKVVFVVKEQQVVKDIITKLEQAEYIQYELTEEILTIESKGASTHCSTPEQGRNALSQLLELIQQIEVLQVGALVQLIDAFGTDCYGEQLGIACDDELSGKLTFNLGVLTLEGTTITIQSDIRYPVTANYEQLRDKLIQQVSSKQVIYQEIEHLASIYFPVDDPLIVALMEVYQQYTGDMETKPMVIGGGTYARALPNTVAFGPLFVGQRELAHEENEFIEIDHLVKLVDIYTLAIAKLTQL